jgi:hypothetical protein
MSRSDSDIDLDAYTPSLEDRRETADEQAAQERLRKALDNPALDEALADVRRARVGARVSKPSPWANGAASVVEPIDKAALPSASAPGAPAEGAATKENEPRRRPWPLWLKVLCALALLASPALAIYVLFVKPLPSGGHATGATTSAVATPPTFSTSAVAPPPAASSAPSAETTASASPATAPPTTAPSGAASAATSAAVPAPERPHGPTKHPSGSVDPYEDAAVALHPPPTAPPNTAEPVAPPSQVQTADPVAPPPVPKPTASPRATPTAIPRGPAGGERGFGD